MKKQSYIQFIFSQGVLVMIIIVLLVLFGIISQWRGIADNHWLAPYFMIAISCGGAIAWLINRYKKWQEEV
jgi:hypothetical protein